MKQNKIISDPSLKDVLDLWKKDIFLSMNCHAIGTIQSFDSSKQTAKITINYKKTFFDRDASGVYNPVLVDYPILLDCPVVIMQGGDCALTFPIASGDTCLVLFNDRDIDNWFTSGQVGPVNTPRLHSFADGMAIIGLNSLNNSLEDYDATRVVLKNGTTFVGISPTLIKIANDLTTLNTALQHLCTAIEGIVTTNCVVGSPVTLNPASILAIQNAATELGTLLE